ncbi:hypothetical protein INT45_006448 [Circinella minor]|uniref:Uncharacterized protein n=1 Tax=Circinella minor TaxID=1195481 RepID=A0A8H7SEZ3_9FUNG|nr:hypothetical protein INT45_006448 [Circinella minor]
MVPRNSPPPLETYMFLRNDRFRPWWISDRKSTIIYTFYDYVSNDKEACQLLRRNFSGETSLIIRTLEPINYIQCDDQQEEQEKKWVVLEALIQPEKSYNVALRRGLKIKRDQQVTVVPAIHSRAAGAYMIMRFSGLPYKKKEKNRDDDDYDDEDERTCVYKVRKSMGSIFPYWEGEKIQLLDAFAETVDEQDAVRFKGSVIVILDGDYYIPQKNVDSGLAYIAEYNTEVKFEHIGPFQYSAYCSTCRTIDSHTPENCKYFEKEYPGGLLL